MKNNRRLRVRTGVRFLLFFSELALTDPWCNSRLYLNWKNMRRKRQMNNLGKCVSHCMKSVQIRSFFWSVFSWIRTEYEEILRISQYSARIRKSTDQKKLRIWTLFTQCRGWLLLRHFSCLSYIYLHVQQKPKLSHTKIVGNSSGGEGEQQIISIVYLFLVIYNSLRWRTTTWEI